MTGPHVTSALDALIRASNEQDSARRREWQRVAEVLATDRLADKVEEFVTAMKLCTNQIIDAQGTLDRNVRLAAEYLHNDANELKAQLRVIRGEAA